VLPKIGITCHPDYAEEKLTLGRYYVRAIEKCSGIPFILPAVSEEEIIKKYCEMLDGLLLSGGVDVDPEYFGEQPVGTREITPERDLFEISLVRKFLAVDKPILGICRGVQIINIAAKGSIYQDIEGQIEGVITHMQKAPKWYPTHTIMIEPGTKLGKIYRGLKSRVNSFHHQATKDLAPGFCVSARALDGVIEAIESRTHRFVLGVQWHPEQMIFDDLASLRLFKAFVDASTACKE